MMASSPQMTKGRYGKDLIIEISLDKIKREREISTPGSQNTVWKGTYASPSGPMTVAVKNCAKFKREEALILQQLRHPNIIEFVGAARLQLAGYAVLAEYAEKGSLYDLIKQHPDDWADFKKHCWIKWAVEMARGLQYIHQQKYQHGDVKSPNMVVTRDDTLKICDFGTARHCEGTVSTENIRGSWPWMAPEVMGDPRSQIKPKVTPKSDVFSYAVVVWELLTGKAPFPGEYAFNILKAVVIEGRRLEIPIECPEPLRDLLTECWDHDHTKRPSMDEILRRSELALLLGEWTTCTISKRPPQVQKNLQISQSGSFEQVEEAAVSELIKESHRSAQRLEQIALNRNPIGVREYLDVLIESEKARKSPGWEKIVGALEATKQREIFSAAVKDVAASGSAISSIWSKMKKDLGYS